MARYLEIPDQEMTQAIPIRLLNGEWIGEGWEKDWKKSVLAFCKLANMEKQVWLDIFCWKKNDSGNSKPYDINNLDIKCSQLQSACFTHVIIVMQESNKPRDQVNDIFKWKHTG